MQRLRRAAPGVEVAIDELVLHGFPASARHAIGEAFGRELERLLSAGDVRSAFPPGAGLPVLDAGRFSIASSARAEMVGARVAHAVYTSLKAAKKEKQA
jgi:hypothetical protein